MSTEEKVRKLRAAARELRDIAEPVGTMHAYWEWIFDLEQEAHRLEKGR